MARADRTTMASCRVTQEADLLRVRQLLRERSRQAGFDLVDETKLITAGSELARNILKYATDAGGEMQVDLVRRDRHQGLRAVFADTGPGIDNVSLAMTDGFSTDGGRGLGLQGAKRLVDDFSIDSIPGKGTTVTIVKWIR